MTAQLATILAGLPDDVRRSALAKLSAAELSALEYAWPVWARPDQLPPPRLADAPYRTWAQLGGRGSGKTRSSAEAVRAEVETGRHAAIALLGPTADTLRRDQVATLLSISPPWAMPAHETSRRQVVWPNGAVAHLLSSEEPDRIRGLNVSFAWCDEFCAWSNQEDCWSNLQMALRVAGPTGAEPWSVISTTPKRQKLFRDILNDPSTVVSKSRTMDNRANLDASTLRHLEQRYGGTTLGRQELDAELLDDVEGALWTRALIDRSRVKAAPELRRIVVAIDPAGGSGATSDETGIVVAGVAGSGRETVAYVLADLSGRYTPEAWARRAVAAFNEHKADRIIAEKNFGGEMVEAVIRGVSYGVPVKMVTASRGKAVRAEPVVSFYEQNRVHHVGDFTTLEDQLCGWDPAEGGKSPDRLDALVWGLTELMVEPQNWATVGSLRL